MAPLSAAVPTLSPFQFVSSSRTAAAGYLLTPSAGGKSMMEAKKKRQRLKAKMCVIDADVLNKVLHPDDDIHPDDTSTDDDISTQMETSRSASSASIDVSPVSSASIADHSGKPMSPQLPESTNDTSTTCIRNRNSLLNSINPNRGSSLDGASLRNAELDELACVIASRVQSKLLPCSGIVRIQPVFENLHNAFSKLDNDCDGKLTQAETLAFFQQFSLPSETASQFFTILGGDKTGLANWHAFMAKYALLFKGKSWGAGFQKAF